MATKARLPACIRWAWLVLPLPGFAQITNDIPPLRPAYPELPPTFWEQHGVWVAVLGGLLIVLGSFAVWWVLRPRPPVVVPIEIQTRQELGTLSRQSEDGRTLSQVSRSVRRYVTVAFHLPPGELTTAEFCNAIASQSEIDSEFASSLHDFLRRCDELKFAPAQPSPPFGAAQRALQLVERGEARRAQLRQTAVAVAAARPGRTS